MKIQDEFIPYSEALALEELGFDEPCLGNYKKTGSLHVLHYGTCGSTKNDNFNILAPLYQQAFRWFREKYKLFVTIPRSTKSETFAYLIATKNEGWFMQKDRFSTYEKAELECLKKLIEIVKNK